MPSRPPVKPDAPDLPDELRTVAARQLGELDIEAIKLEKTDFAGQTGSSLRIDQSWLQQVDLADATVKAGLLTDVVVAGGSWANARLPDTRLRRVTARNVRMTGLDLSGVELEDVTFVECQMDLAAFRKATLKRVRFERCKLDEVDFSGAELSSVVFVESSLQRSSWAEAHLFRCEMRGSDITGAVNPECLRGLRMPWEDVLASAAVFAAASGIEIVD